MKLFLISLVALTAVAGDLEIITLQHRDADSLVPLLRSMYGSKATIAGRGPKIFVEATPDVSREIRTIVASLDGKPRLLRVSLRSPSKTSGQSTQLAASGRASFGPGTVTVRNREPAAGGGLQITNAPSMASVSGARLQANQASVSQNGMSEQSILVEEGVPSTITDANGNQLTVKVVGDMATVQMSSSPLSPNVQGISTTAPVGGSWTSIGGTSQSSDSSGSGILSHTSDSNQGSTGYQLKVTPVN